MADVENKDLTNPNEQTDETHDDQKDSKNNEPDVNELLKQLAQERANSAKTKTALDKALKQVGELTKSLRARQSAEEIAEETKKEEAEKQQKYIRELEEYRAKAEAKSRYALQGMSAEMAEKAAEAEIKGDMDELASIFKKHTDSVVKTKESEWLKNRPAANVGSGENTVTLEQFNKMSLRDKTKLFREDRSTYDRLVAMS